MTVSAKYFSKTLADHLSGFLAANGVKDIPFVETSPVYIFLNELPSQMKLDKFKDAAWSMKKMTGLRHCVCLEFIAISFGYTRYAEARDQMRGNFIVRKEEHDV